MPRRTNRPCQGSTSLGYFVQGKTGWAEQEEAGTPKTQDIGPSLATCSTSCRSPGRRQAVPSKAHSSLIRNIFVFKDGEEALDVGVACVLKMRGTAEQVPGTILHIFQGGSNREAVASRGDS